MTTKQACTKLAFSLNFNFILLLLLDIIIKIKPMQCSKYNYLALIMLAGLSLSCGGSSGSATSSQAQPTSQQDERNLELSENAKRLKAGEPPIDFKVEILTKDGAKKIDYNQAITDGLYDYALPYTAISNSTIIGKKLYFIHQSEAKKRAVFIADLAQALPSLSLFSAPVGGIDSTADINSEINEPVSLEALNIEPQALAVDEDWLYLSSYKNLVRFKLSDLEDNQLTSAAVNTMQHYDFSELGEINSFKPVGEYLYLKTTKGEDKKFARFKLPSDLASLSATTLQMISCPTDQVMLDGNEGMLDVLDEQTGWQIIGDHIYSLFDTHIRLPNPSVTGEFRSIPRDKGYICLGAAKANAGEDIALSLQAVEGTDSSKLLDAGVLKIFDKAYVFSYNFYEASIINNKGELGKTVSFKGQIIEPRKITLNSLITLVQLNGLAVAFDEQAGDFYSFVRGKDESDKSRDLLIRLTPEFAKNE